MRCELAVSVMCVTGHTQCYSKQWLNLLSEQVQALETIPMCAKPLRTLGEPFLAQSDPVRCSRNDVCGS